jgi:hypothetical protein
MKQLMNPLKDNLMEAKQLMSNKKTLEFSLSKSAPRYLKQASPLKNLNQ